MLTFGILKIQRSDHNTLRMVNNLRHRSVRTRLMLVAALLFAQAGATAHLLDHASDLYDQACRVCVVSQQFDHFSSGVTVATTGLSVEPACEAAPVPALQIACAYHRPFQRGPPASTSVSA